MDVGSQPELAPEAGALVAKKALREALRNILGISCLVGIALLVTVYTGTVWATLRSAGTLLWFAACFVIPLVMHEVGHMVAGWLVGYRWIALRMSKVRLTRSPLRIMWDSSADFDLSGSYRGEILPERWSPLREIIMIVGGPGAELLIASIALIILLKERTNHGAMQDSLQMLLILSVLSLRPLLAKAEEPWTDSARLRFLIKHGKHLQPLRSFHPVIRAARSGIRPKDWDEGWGRDLLAVHSYLIQARMSAPQEQAMLYVIWLQLLYWGWDRRDSRLLEELVEQSLGALGDYPERSREVILSESAFFSAALRCQASVARALLDQAGLRQPEIAESEVKVMGQMGGLRIDFALNFAEGNLQVALAKGTEWLTLLNTRKEEQSVYIQVERDWVIETLAQLQVRLQSADESETSSLSVATEA